MMLVQEYLKKKQNIWEVKIKPKNDMMYQDIIAYAKIQYDVSRHNCICQKTKKMKIYYPVCQTYRPTGV